MKELFLVNLVEESLYQTMFNMIEDRNKLSHVYEEKLFEEIHGKLGRYLSSLKCLLSDLAPQ